MRSFDILIVGGGMVGLTQALAIDHLCCGSKPLTVAVVDSQSGNQPLSDQPELRVSAINMASERLFGHIGVWKNIADVRLQPYFGMQVWEQDSFARIEFDHQQAGQTHLGHIIENQLIRQSLWDAAERSENIELIAAASISKLDVGERDAFVTLDNGELITARLVVGADGANSWVRRQMNLPITHWDYEHKAIVATIKTELPHLQQARQVFTPTGPLALLPLWQDNLCSIVWSQDNREANRLLAMTDTEFNQALSSTFDMQAGLCELHSERISYPLQMRYARQWVKPRLALIGDAAHTIHPLAGQGANLGLMDAAALAQNLAELHLNNKDIGLYKSLRSYERWRKTEALKLVASMEGLKRLFNGANPLQKLLRGSGMALANKLPMLKNTAIRQAMGLDGELPELAK
ncbi:FAD-dependent monooxygenase [Neptunicella sp. SCSIO 80796]|uniref:FAD-dependent monooxygenase n=1 Tax=Neptunicella plasticusilytica TaxID=3117012 RepID=UPI003A4DB086